MCGIKIVPKHELNYYNLKNFRFKNIEFEKEKQKYNNPIIIKYKNINMINLPKLKNKSNLLSLGYLFFLT